MSQALSCAFYTQELIQSWPDSYKKIEAYKSNLQDSGSGRLQTQVSSLQCSCTAVVHLAVTHLPHLY